MRERELHAGRSLPLRVEDGDVRRGLPLFLSGLVVVAFGALFVLVGLASPGAIKSPVGFAIIIAVLALGGLAMCLSGVHRMLYRLRVTVDHRSVIGERRGLSGTRTWNEPLKRYLGVLQEIERNRHGLHLITLKHFRDDAYDVLLYRSLQGDSHRRETEEFAQLLGVPVLSEIGKGRYTARAAADLDKSVARLATEGKLAVPEVPSAPLASRSVRSLQRENGVAFEQRFTGQLIAFGAIFAVVGSGLLYWYLGPGVRGGTGDPRLVLLAGTVFALLGLALMLLAPALRLTLEVDPERVRTALRLGAHAFHEGSLAAGAVEEVRIAPQRNGLLIIADEGRLWFGLGLRERELEHVRDAALATVACAGRQGREQAGSARAASAGPSPQVASLGRLAADGLARGRTPAQVYAQLIRLGVPATDVAACLRSIAADPASPHAGAVLGYLQARAPGVMALDEIRHRATVKPAGREAQPDAGVAGRTRILAFKLPGYAVALAILAWIAAVHFDIVPQKRSPVRATTAETAPAAHIPKQFADFAIKPEPAPRTWYAYIGAQGIHAEVHGADLRIALERVVLEKRPERERVEYTQLGINVYPLSSARSEDGRSAWDGEIRGMLTAEAPSATLESQVFVLPGIGERCRASCRARLLLTVRTSPSSSFTENTPFATFQAAATRDIALPAASPSRFWDTYYDRALAARQANRHAEAERLFADTLAFIEKNLGSGHPAAARTLATLAGLYKTQKRNAEYERAMLRALEILDPLPDRTVKQSLGETRLLIDKELLARQLGDFYWDQRSYAEALRHYRLAHRAVPGIETSDYDRNLRLASSAAGIMASACVLGDFETADAAMRELKERVTKVEPAARRRLEYWIRTGEPRLQKRQC
jgi:hypothetical protein